MSGEERLAQIFEQLRALGMSCLVMGGHAVRFYGIDRSTLDYDLVAALEPHEWERLEERLRSASALSGCHEGHSWRPRRRFIIGTLPDGREERLEFWRRNHLLAPYPELAARRVEGNYGGKTLAFLGIDDLVRSKETEREDDWRDVRLLEEIADERRLAGSSPRSASDALAREMPLRVREHSEVDRAAVLGPEA